jgi:hypothetical protein
MARNGFSSLGYSVQANLPYYAPPVTPQTNYIRGGSSAVVEHPSFQPVDQHTGLVNRMPRMLGIRWLYSRGGQIKPWFRMIATGAVESTKFQPVLSYTWDAEFNDAIYQAGYPRNLGFTFKVPTIPSQALGSERYSMLPRPRFSRSIFARRAVTSGVRPLPAQGTNPGRRQR